MHPDVYTLLEQQSNASALVNASRDEVEADLARRKRGGAENITAMADTVRAQNAQTLEAVGLLNESMSYLAGNASASFRGTQEKAVSDVDEAIYVEESRLLNTNRAIRSAMEGPSAGLPICETGDVQLRQNTYMRHMFKPTLTPYIFYRGQFEPICSRQFWNS